MKGNADLVGHFTGSIALQVHVFITVPTGQRKLEKVREFEWSGKGQGKIFLGKFREKIKGEYETF